MLDINMYSSLFKILAWRAEDNSLHRVEYGEEIFFNCRDPVIVGWDQSASCTGMAIVSKERDLVGLVEFVNKGLPDQHYFQIMLERTVSVMLGNLNIELFILEKHYRGSQARRSHESLARLKFFIEDMRFRHSIFEKVEIKDIYAQSWKSEYLKDKRYKGSFGKGDVKDATCYECVRRYPDLSSFRLRCSRTMDGFDAMGLTYGWIGKNYDEFGIKKVNKSMQNSSRHGIAVTINKYKLSEIKKKAEEFHKLNSNDIEVIKLDENLTLRENASRYTNNTNKVGITSVSHGSLFALEIMWRDLELLESDEGYLLSIRRCKKKKSLTDKFTMTRGEIQL